MVNTKHVCSFRFACCVWNIISIFIHLICYFNRFQRENRIEWREQKKGVKNEPARKHKFHFYLNTSSTFSFGLTLSKIGNFFCRLSQELRWMKTTSDEGTRLKDKTHKKLALNRMKKKSTTMKNMTKWFVDSLHNAKKQQHEYCWVSATVAAQTKH